MKRNGSTPFENTDQDHVPLGADMRGPQEKGRKKPHPVTCMIDMGEEQER